MILLSLPVESKPGSNDLLGDCPLTFYLASQGLADYSGVLLLVCWPLVHKQGCVGGAGVKHDSKLRTTLGSNRCGGQHPGRPAQPSQQVPEPNLGVCRQEDVGGLHQDEQEHGEARGCCDPQEGHEDPFLPGESHGRRGELPGSGGWQWTLRLHLLSQPQPFRGRVLIRPNFP